MKQSRDSRKIAATAAASSGRNLGFRSNQEIVESLSPFSPSSILVMFPKQSRDSRKAPRCVRRLAGSRLPKQSRDSRKALAALLLLEERRGREAIKR